MPSPKFWTLPDGLFKLLFKPLLESFFKGAAAVLFGADVDFFVALAADGLVFDFDVSVTVSEALFEVAVAEDRIVVVTVSGLATTSCTTADTFTRLASFAPALATEGRGAMLNAVTGVLTVTCSIASASSATERRTTLDEVAVRDSVDTGTRAGKVGATVVVGSVVTVSFKEKLPALMVVGLAVGEVPRAEVFTVTDPMVLTVVVAVVDRRIDEVLETVEAEAAEGVETITNEVTSGPACVVGVVEPRSRTCRDEPLAALVAVPIVESGVGRFLSEVVVAAEEAGTAPNQNATAAAALTQAPCRERALSFLTVPGSSSRGT